jgi:hypothetical protein
MLAQNTLKMRPPFVRLANLVKRTDVFVECIGSCSRQLSEQESADADRLAGTDPDFDSRLSKNKATTAPIS